MGFFLFLESPLSPMLINFAHEGLARIDCDCLQYDGHPASNLISLNKTRRTKGFLADRFIKPPTNITLFFSCDVNVSKVVLKPRVGGQKSSGFELLKVLRNKATVSIAQTVISDEVERVVFGLSDQSEKGVRFCSDRAGDRIRELRVKIFKTCGSTVPALGGLEIWGRPSPHLPESLRNDIVSKWKSVCCQTIPVSSSSSPKKSDSSEQVPSSSSQIVISPELKIPEEFIDPISCEVMTIPMTLPSGNIVDLTTLEKFHETQAKLGRSQCDPFTGVLFSDHSQPVVATSLKSRLDKFLLEHANVPSIKTLPRALGRKPSTASSQLQGTSVSQPAQTSRIRTVDQLLSSCLDGLPSYLDAPAEEKRPKFGCVSCSKSNDSPLFRLPCGDLTCRECLCSMKQRCENICSLCRAKFDFTDVMRYHV